MLSLLLATVCIHVRAQPPPPLLVIDIDASANFNISIAGSRWLGNAPIRAFANPSGTPASLLRKTGTRSSSGTDALGAFACVNVSWVAEGGHVLHTAVKTYPENPDVVVFTQQVLGGAAGTNASNPRLPSGVRAMDPGNYPPIVAFPALAGGRLAELGYVTWQSRMINVEWGTNVTNGTAGTNEPLLTGRGLQGLSTNGQSKSFYVEH